MKLDRNGRALLFWGACMPLRWYLSTRGDQAWLRAFAAIAGVRWLAGYEVGDEGMFGGPAWWKEERAAHGMLWTAYAITGASSFLQVDTAIGAANWLSS